MTDPARYLKDMRAGVIRHDEAARLAPVDDKDPWIVFVTETDDEAKALREELPQNCDAVPLRGTLYGARYAVVVILSDRDWVEANEKTRLWVKRELKTRMALHGRIYYTKEYTA